MSTALLEPARGHPALIWLIRGAGVLLAGVSATAILVLMWAACIQFLHTHNPLGILVVPFLMVMPGVLVKIGYDMYRKVSSTTVPYFSFLFALILASVWYHLLPANLPAHIASFCRENALLANLAGQGDHPVQTYRGTLAFLCFVLFYNLIKAYLFQILGLNSSAPQDPTPPGPDDTNQPFVPFNPYDLSKNPPYLPQSSR